MAADALERLGDAVLRSFPEWAEAGIELAPLAGGITNDNAVVTVPGSGRFVARLPGERTELLGIDRAHEADAARRATELGIGPPVRGVLEGVGTLVTEFVPGVHLEPAEFLERLDEVVALVKRLHDSGPLAGAFPIHRVVEWHARDAVAHGVALPDVYSRLHAVSARIEAAFGESPDPPVACHNDLLPANVLFGPDRTWLLDFEYAGMNDRYFDLANLSVNCGLDPAADARLLACYEGRVSARGLARLSLMKVMSEFREGMWAVVQQAISTLDTDFAGYAERRLSSAIALADAIDLERLLAVAAQPRSAD